MHRYFIAILWLSNILLRFWGIWFPQGGFDEGQNIQGAQLITNFFEGTIDRQIVTIYGFLGKVLSFLPYHFGNWCEAHFQIQYDIPLGLVFMRFFIAFIPSILTIHYSIKTLNLIHQSPYNQVFSLAFFLITFKHIESAHYAVNDALISCLAIATLYYYSRSRMQQYRSNWFTIGLLAALASAAKIHIGLLLLGSIGLNTAFAQFSKGMNKQSLISYLRFVQKIVLVFALSSLLINLPYVLHWRLWLGEIWYHIKSYPFYYKGSFLTYFYFNPSYGVGIPLLLFAFLGGSVVLWKKEFKNWGSIFIYLLAFLVFLSTSRGAIHRWAIPITPVVVLLAVRFLSEFTVQFKSIMSNNKQAYAGITILLILVSSWPIYQAFKLDYNLSLQDNTYRQLNAFMVDAQLQGQSAGKYHETSSLNFELPALTEITVAELKRKGINYLIFSNFYFPKNQPNFISHPSIAQQLRLKEWQDLRFYIEENWELERIIAPPFYTHWSTNIANAPPFYIYKRPTKQKFPSDSN